MAEKKTKNKISKILIVIFLIINLIIFSAALFINNYFNDISFEQLLYNIINSKGADYTIIIYGAIFTLIVFMIIALISIVIYKIYKFSKINVIFKIKVKDKKINFSLFKKTYSKTIILSMFIYGILLLNSFKLLNLGEYIKSQTLSTNIYDEYYIDGKDIELKFPKNKRNLIYIFVESLESSNISKKNGGIVEKSYIPNLEKMALENINFSHNEKIGGAIQAANTGWTIGGMVAQTAGVPLKLSIDGNSYKGYKQFLPGVYNIGDILKANGYKNYIMFGSDADFGGRKDYFKSHGNYEIYDYVYAKKEKLIDEDYKVWWGYEDEKLFSFAKDKLNEISKLNEPFNFTLLTADTHFPDGYIYESCDSIFNLRYANSFYCSDKKINDFINWIKKQDFYKNTTIVIVGDHLTMQSNFYTNMSEENRNIYNVFLNSFVDTENTKNRQFSPLDIFPTTLASLGVEIEGNKLGLGVNLFSDEETLYEKFGIKYINEELSKKSFFYDNKLLGDTYYKMQGR